MSQVATAVDLLLLRERQRSGPRSFANGQSQTAADTVSTSNTATFVDAMVWQWDELPDGLYVVRVDATLLFAHSATGQVSMRVLVNGAAGTTHNPQAPNESPATMPFRIVETFTEVEAADGAGIELQIEFKGVDSGTTSARNPAISADALRVG